MFGLFAAGSTRLAARCAGDATFASTGSRSGDRTGHARGQHAQKGDFSEEIFHDFLSSFFLKRFG
jgi:hypothetical protein